MKPTNLLLCCSFILALFVLPACNNSSSNKQATSTSSGTNVLYEDKISEEFSEKGKKDLFTLVLTGKDIENSTVEFSIHSQDGKELYKDTFKGKDFLGTYDPKIDLSKESNRKAFIKERIGDFFDDENFLDPALTADAVIDELVPDKKIFEEIKAHGGKGFKYTLGKENSKYLAYSPKLNKIVIYYNCC